MTAMADADVRPVPERSLAATAIHAETVLQAPSAQLIHVQSDRAIPLPDGCDRFRIGKPNDRYPPDLDVSGFAHSEIVSRVHAEIRLEGQTYYIEDVGSSNGTYVNFMPLRRGTRHALQTGDRIALGKGDLVTFEFKRS
jgi:pSer/pThr/pTyr-binding forkhead associated (FHA) protein